MPKDRPPPEPKKYQHWTQEQYDAKRDEVRKLAQIGATDEEIGFVIGRSEQTVKNQYREELSEGRANVRLRLRKRQLEAALNEGNPTMMIWLGKQMLGQREPKQNVEHSGNLSVEKVLYNSVQLEAQAKEIDGQIAEIEYDDKDSAT